MTMPDAVTKTITFTLDGKQIEAAGDETIWQAAARHGTDIPHLCYKDTSDYRADGNCRACMVEIEGERVLAASCIRTPTEGMVVNSDSHRAETARKMVMELLVADQPNATPRMIRIRNYGIMPRARILPNPAFRQRRPLPPTTAIPPLR